MSKNITFNEEDIKFDIANAIRAFMAGILIGIGGSAYLVATYKHGSPLIGVFLFAIALLSICLYRCNLYTGKICFVLVGGGISRTEIYDHALMLLFNSIGAILMGVIFKIAHIIPENMVEQVVLAKINLLWYEKLLRGFLCGICVYIAVNAFHPLAKINSHLAPIVLIIAVMVFVLSGFEHSIADIFYFAAYVPTKLFTWEGFSTIGLIIIGNTIGGMFLPTIGDISKRILYGTGYENYYD